MCICMPRSSVLSITKVNSDDKDVDMLIKDVDMFTICWLTGCGYVTKRCGYVILKMWIC